MMTSEQSKMVSLVYRQFASSEELGWGELDENLCLLEYLDDDQLHREADVLLSKHQQGKPECRVKHEISACFVPKIIEAVSVILELYKETGNLHKNNRYVLQYYLALSQINHIVS